MTTGKALLSEETIQTLNCIHAGIFVANLQHELVWINDVARTILNDMKEDIHITSPDDVIGKHLSEFHSNFAHKQRNILEGINMPYSSKISLWGKYTAEISISTLQNLQKETTGYLLVWNDVTVKEEVIKKNQLLLEELSTPIMPTIIDDALLVPLIGSYDQTRFDALQKKLLNACVQGGIDFIVFDFSSMKIIDNDQLVMQIEMLSEAVALVGAEPVYVAFPKDMVKQFVANGVRTNKKVFRTYKVALEYLMKQKGYDIVKNDQINK
ncbi:hypothetical protein [Bacillus alkalicellulosilyticus]|uniref:hypothetical protein n=1 Tax=Alkalihalobacterium alkalicellulosilyticum TaxID=1912214 RepID=UPI000996EB27|nr:hypothetical protein [Bacillus alkalicellulosilyticus]